MVWVATVTKPWRLVHEHSLLENGPNSSWFDHRAKRLIAINLNLLGLSVHHQTSLVSDDQPFTGPERVK